MARIETPKRVRGTQDIFGDEQRRFAQVLGTFEHVHGLYAFQRLDLPLSLIHISEPTRPY